MATQDMVDYHTEILSSVLTKSVDDDDEDSDPLIDVEFFKLHGNMTQKERTGVFKTFSQTKSGVLLCTVSLSFSLACILKLSKNYFENVHKIFADIFLN